MTSTSIPLQTNTEATPAQRATRTPPRLTHRWGFWVTAAAFLVMMAFNTVPTPLYAIYQRRDDFPTVMITVIFAAYSIGVMLALYLAGHLSDRWGRRRIILSSVAIEIASGALFLVLPSAIGLIAARFISGLGIGMLTATATAHLSDLRRITQPAATAGFAATIAGVANMGGLALGPLIGGVFAKWATQPLVTPYVVFLIAIAVVGVAYAFVPETVDHTVERGPYRPQRVRVPAENRRAYWATGIGSFAAFAVTGLFGSVAPTFLAELLHQSDHLVAGIVSFAVFGAAALAQLLFARLSTRTQVQLGVGAMIAGLISLGAADLTTSAPLFVGGGVVAGAGVGLVFRGALAKAASLGTTGNRGEITAGIFLLAFAGMTVPPLLVGAALLVLPLVPTFLGFVVLVLALITWAGPAMVRSISRHPTPSLGETTPVSAA